MSAAGVVSRTRACTFSDGGARGSLVVLKPDLLQGHQVLGEFAPPFEDRGVGALETARRKRTASDH